MNQTICVLLGIVSLGIIVLLCLFLPIFNKVADIYWEELRRSFDDKK